MLLLPFLDNGLVASHKVALVGFRWLSDPPCACAHLFLNRVNFSGVFRLSFLLHLLLTVTFDLEGVRINLEFLDLVDWRHVLLVVLLSLLLLAELSKLEHLEPAFVAEDHCTELNHLAVYCVVRGYLVD